MSSRIVCVPALLLAASLVGACSKDPEVAKREFVRTGDAFVKEQKFPEAILQYRNAVQQDPRFGQARQKLAGAYLHVGDSTNAYREAIRAADLLPDDKVAQLQAGEMLLMARQFEEARIRADKALAKDPKYVDAQILRAYALGGLNKIDDAVGEFEDAIRTAPDRATSYTSLGAAQLARGERQEAEAAFRKAVDTAPRSIDARLGLASYYWAVGRKTDAEEHFKAALTIEPKNNIANRALAIFYIVSRRPKEAEEHLKVIAEIEPDSDGKLSLADYYVTMQRPEDARQILEGIVAHDQKAFGQATLRLAGLRLYSGNAAEALPFVEAVLAKEPANSDALMAKGRLMATMGKWDEAFTAIKAAAAAEPRSSEAQSALGEMYARRGEEPEAVAAFTKALQLNPRMAPPEVGLARIHFVAGRLDDAERFSRAAIAKAPGYVDAHLILAQIQLRRGNLAQAEPIVRTLARVLPDRADVLTDVGRLELLKGNRAAARRAFEQAFDRNPAAIDVLANLVKMDLQDKRPAEATARLEAARRRTPKDSTLFTLSAGTSAHLGDMVSTERFAKEAVDLDPGNIEAFTLLGELYHSQGRTAEALALYTQLEQKKPKAVGPPTMIGILLELSNKPADAQKAYERALANDKSAAVAANNLAWLQVQAGGNLDIAMNLARTAKAGLPDQHQVNDTLGWIYYKKGLPADAIGPLQQATKARSDIPTYYYHLGLAYAASGKEKEAKVALEKSLSLKGDAAEAAEARKALAGLKG